MDGPQDKERDVQMVSGVEDARLMSLNPFYGGSSDERQCNKHDGPRPARSCGEAVI